MEQYVIYAWWWHVRSFKQQLSQLMLAALFHSCNNNPGQHSLPSRMMLWIHFHYPYTWQDVQLHWQAKARHMRLRKSKQVNIQHGYSLCGKMVCQKCHWYSCLLHIYKLSVCIRPLLQFELCTCCWYLYSMLYVVAIVRLSRELS